MLKQNADCFFYTYRCMYYICDDVKTVNLFQAKTLSFVLAISTTFFIWNKF